jgi:hypothetical protein
LKTGVPANSRAEGHFVNALAVCARNKAVTNCAKESEAI